MSEAFAYEIHPTTAGESNNATTSLRGHLLRGTLTQQHLHAAIKMVDPEAMGNPSVGMWFIQRHLDDFFRLVPMAQRMDFFMQHLDNPGIVSVITNFELFRGIPTEAHARLVYEITSRWPMTNIMWLTNAVQTVLTTVLFECIKMQLDETRFTLEQSHRFAKHFLLGGAGTVARNGEYMEHNGDPCYVFTDRGCWFLVPEREFAGIIQLCLERAPEAIFMPGTGDESELAVKLRAIRPEDTHDLFETVLMLDYQTVDELTVKAAELLTSMHVLRVRALLRLPLKSQQLLAGRRLPYSLEFLVRTTLLDHGSDDEAVSQAQLKLFDEHFGHMGIQPEDLLETYWRLAPELLTYAPDSQTELAKTARRINECLLGLLASHGYLVGRVVRERSPRSQAVLYSLNRSERKTHHQTPSGRLVKIVQNNNQSPGLFTEGMLAYVDLNLDDYARRRLAAGHGVVFGMLIPLDYNTE